MTILTACELIRRSDCELEALFRLFHEPRTVLEEIEREMGPISFSAQYLQAPIPGWLIFKRNWIRETARPAYDGTSEKLIVSWDIALSEAETGDYSACAVLLQRGDMYHVLEMMRGRWRFDELKRRVIDSRRRFDGALVIEESPISEGLIQSVRENRINVVAIKPTSDKRARAIAQTDLFAGRSVSLSRAPCGCPSSSRFPAASMTIRSMR